MGWTAFGTRISRERQRSTPFDDGQDVCSAEPDPSQSDADGDGRGDACDADPRVDAVEPTTGGPGTLVQIRGANLASDDGLTVVEIGGAVTIAIDATPGALPTPTSPRRAPRTRAFTSASPPLRRFAARFRKSEWPGKRWPRVYYDPRALALGPGKQASVHAKCVLVDGRWVLVTSANFTEAAQERNLELGLSVEDPIVAQTIEAQFAWLVAQGHLVRVPGL